MPPGKAFFEAYRAVFTEKSSKNPYN